MTDGCLADGDCDCGRLLPAVCHRLANAESNRNCADDNDNGDNNLDGGSDTLVPQLGLLKDPSGRPHG